MAPKCNQEGSCLLWLWLLLHWVHSSWFCVTAQGLSAMNGMQIQPGERSFHSKASTGGRAQENVLGEAQDKLLSLE